MNANALNFDIYAMARPKSMEDIVALAQEAHRLLDIIETGFDALFARCEQSCYA